MGIVINAVQEKDVGKRASRRARSAEKRERGGKRRKSRELEMSGDKFQDIMVARDSGLGFGEVGVQNGDETRQDDGEMPAEDRCCCCWRRRTRRRSERRN